MDLGLVVSYVLAVAGLAVAAVSLWLLRTANIDRRYGNATLLKLFAANNASRARKLCLFAPHSYFTAVGAAIDAGLALASRDRATLSPEIDRAFAAKSHEVAARWRGLVERALLGVMLALGGVALAASLELVPVPLYVAGGLALLAAGWLAIRRGAMAETLEAARLEILPALITSIVDGPIENKPAPSDTGPVRVAASNPRASLGGGVCPLCAHKTITRVDVADARFHKLVCRGCGYTQEFADLAKLDA